MTQNKTDKAERPKKIRRIFESIAFRYDLLNHLLSFGMDFYWRKKALKLTGVGPDTVLLDVACGTGDFAVEARKQGVKNIIGADFSYNMLNLFNRKCDWIKGKNLQTAAEFLPLKDESVTNITVAFGVRNFYDIPTAFENFHRVLTRNGKITILEFRLPKSRPLRFLYNSYFKYVLPVVGGLISRDYEAYKYLPESVEEFDKKVDLVELLKNAEFGEIKRYILTLGIVQVVIGQK
ncbi:MAG: bifunctional demethylmenaquinone methyltransferase/2-methoxy-6-polyprenyl-1,4-benzoquinol methylase UbiE [Ignavibacteriaceae bacterium]